jgi:hypothetical protein
MNPEFPAIHKGVLISGRLYHFDPAGPEMVGTGSQINELGVEIPAVGGIRQASPQNGRPDGTTALRVIAPRTVQIAALPHRAQERRRTMTKRVRNTLKRQDGKIGYILAWLLGVPIPILILVYLLRGCT